ncbi:MAG: hypothetical protein KIS87_01770 [Phycisphaeraceae bacterium]|nr:hypothetical protein [Phycisphaeraceae bacterium]
MSAHQEPHETPIVHEQPDAWHRHTLDEGKPQHEHGARAKPAILAGVCISMVVSVVAMVLGVAIYFEWYVTRLKADRTETITAATKARSEKEAAWSSLAAPSAWKDRDAGTVRIPIERAKRLVVEEYRRSGTSGS